MPGTSSEAEEPEGTYTKVQVGDGGPGMPHSRIWTGSKGQLGAMVRRMVTERPSDRMTTETPGGDGVSPPRSGAAAPDCREGG